MNARGPIALEPLSAYARSILCSPALSAKLRPPPADLVYDGAAAEIVAAPARAPSLAMQHVKEKLPPLHTLTDKAVRAMCLSRFAHHELMAIELFAWALLAFPDLPPALRRGFVQTLGEEQEHCQLYLARLAAHDVTFGALPLSGYFWKHADKIATAPNPALAFMCVLGLTFEQANLDFALMFEEGFRAARDGDTAAALRRVHDDEIGHVKLALTWTKKLTGKDDLSVYLAHTPFPFSLARAKARHLDEAGRRAAGMSEQMIAAVRAAKPYAPRGPAPVADPA